MTNQKTLRRSLLSSVIALLVCFAMLLGTTFAWFTDSVTSKSNKIVSGTLKVDLEVLGEDGNYTSVRDMQDPIFNYDKWEPGYTEVKTLKIQNEGSLALKYQLNVVAQNADCILANVIDVYMCFGEPNGTKFTDNNWWHCGTLAKMMADENGFTQGKLLPVGATYDGELLGENGVAIGEITATIALHMQETADNQYQGLDLGNIDIRLLATQWTYEKDSYDDQYDKDAFVADYYVSTADSLIEKLESAKEGEVVGMTSDVKIDPAGMSNAYGTTGINIKNGQTLDGNGNTLDIKGAGGTWDSGINTTGGIIKNITITGSFRGIFVNHNSTHSERVILENVIIDGTTYTISCDQGTNQGLTATNSTFKGWTSYAATLGDAKFISCYFGEGNGYAYCRPYAPTEFVGCAFEAGFKMDPRAAVTFENCTIGGVALTAENLATLVTNTANATVK